MSLKGTKLICLNENGEKEKIIKPEGKFFRFGYYQNSDYILENEKARSIHCEICADAFKRIIIVNHCQKNPITINGFPIKHQRPLFHGSRIKIFDKEFIWEFSKNYKTPISDEVTVGSVNANNDDDIIVTPPKQISEFHEQAPLSEPWKMRNTTQIKRRRLSIHSFAYCIGTDELDNINEKETAGESLSTKTTTDTSEIKENISLNDISILKNTLHHKSTTPTLTKHRCTFDSISPIKSTGNDTTLINLNASIYKDENITPQIKLGLCKTSDLLVTSYSPKTPSHTHQSFALIKSNKNTPKSVYCTPRSVLSEHNNSNDSMMSTNLVCFSTPQTNTFHSSMYLIDLTTPAIIQKTPTKKQNVSSPLLKSALKNSANKNIKSVSKLKSTFAPVLEEPNSPHSIGSGKKKYPVTPSPARNIKSVRKSLNMSINGKEQQARTPNKTPVKTVLSRSVQSERTPNKTATETPIRSNLSIPNSNIFTINKSSTKSSHSNLSIQHIDSPIEIEDLSMGNDDEYEDSVIEVTDDSIDSYKSDHVKSDTETPDKVILGKMYKNTPKSLIRKAILSSAKKSTSSPKNLLSSGKTLTSLTPLSSSKLNVTPIHRSLIEQKFSTRSVGKNRLSCTFASTTAHMSPMRRSLIARKISPRSVGKNRLSCTSNSIGAHISPMRRSIIARKISPLSVGKNRLTCTSSGIGVHTSPSLSSSTPLKRNETLQTSLKNRCSTPLANKTPKKHVCENLKVSNSSVNSILIQSKKIFNNRTEIVQQSFDFTKTVKACEQTKINEESELNQTFTVTESTEEENQFKDEKTINEKQDNLKTKTVNEDLSEKKDFDRNQEQDELSKTNIIPENTSKNIDIMAKHLNQEKYYEQILSSEEKFDNLIGKPATNKQYSPAKKSNTPKNEYLMLNDLETPKTDIQDWINNLSSNTNSKIILDVNAENEKVEDSNRENIPKIENFYNDEIKRVFNKCGSNDSNISISDVNVSGIGILNKSKSIFSEELVISDKSVDDDILIIQSTPNNKKRFIRKGAVTDIKPTRRSSRHLNKSYSCKQCITPPAIHTIKKQLDMKEVITPTKSLKNIKCKQKDIRNTLSNNVTDNKIDLQNKNESQILELEFENLEETQNLTKCLYKTPNNKNLSMRITRRTIEIINKSVDIQPVFDQREIASAFENFEDDSNNSDLKIKLHAAQDNQRKLKMEKGEIEFTKATTPDGRRTKIQNDRKTLGHQVSDTSSDLETAKEEREMESAFENFSDLPNLSEVKAKTPNAQKTKLQNNRKTLGNQISDTSFELEAAKEEREMELAFENFNDLPNLPAVKAKTPNAQKTKIQSNRKTLGNQVLDTSFDLEAAKEEREMELAFENFNDLPNLPAVKAKTPNAQKSKLQNSRKTLGNQVLDTSFDLEAAKEEHEMELAFENFNDLPNLPAVKAKTPNAQKSKLQNNRKTLGNQISDTSFDLEAAKEEREMELAFENFTDLPNLPEIKAKTPNAQKSKLQNSRKTLGNQISNTSFDLEAAKEEREMELAFENFNDLPNLPAVKAKTPNAQKTKIQSNRKTLGNQVLDTSFDLEAAKEEREMELAFENFNDLPNLPAVKAKTPNAQKSKLQNSRKTLGNQISNTSFDLEAAKEEREMELAFENFTDLPNLPEVKAKTPNAQKSKLQNSRKTLGNQISNTSFDLEAAKEEREMELAFENFNDLPNLPAVKAKTPNAQKTKIQSNRKTLGNQVLDTSFDLEAAKEEREMELAFENFNDLPNLPAVKAKTPNAPKTKMQSNRKTLGNQISNTSFDLEAAKEEREMELAFENFNDLPNLPAVKAKTPNAQKNKLKNSRKTLGNQISDTSFDLEAAKEEREMELAFENFTDLPNLPEVKAKTPNAQKSKLQNSRKTLGNQISNTSFDLEAAKEEREMELAFENFNDLPNLPAVKAKTPNAQKNKMQSNRKTLGNQVLDTSFDLEAAKEEREMELAFENFNDLPNLPAVKAKTPNAPKTKMQSNRKTLGNQVSDTSFDLEAAKEEREMELAFENFNDLPNLPAVKAKTPNTQKTKMQSNRKTLGNQVLDTSFDLEAAKKERERELALESLNDMKVVTNSMKNTNHINESVLIQDSTFTSRKEIEDNKNISQKVETIQIKNENRIRKQLINSNEKVELKQNETEQDQGVLQSTPARRRGRTRKLAENIIDTETEKTYTISTPAKGQSTTSKQFDNIHEKLFENNNENEEKEDVNDSAPVRRRVRNRKQIIDVPEIQMQRSETEEERSKTTNQINNAEMQEKKNYSEENETKRMDGLRKSLENPHETPNDRKEEKEIIKKTPVKSVRAKKQFNNLVEKLQTEEIVVTPDKRTTRTRKPVEKLNTEEKKLVITPARGRGRAKNTVAKLLENQIDAPDEEESIKSTPAKSRGGRAKKQVISNEEIQSNEIETEKEVIQNSPNKKRGETTIHVDNVFKEIEVKKNEYEEKVVINKTPPKSRIRTRKQLNSTVEKLQTEEIEIFEVTPARGTTRTRKPVEKFNTEENKVLVTPARGRGRPKNAEKLLENKSDATEEKELIKNTPAKSHGRTRKQLLVEEIHVQTNDEKVKSTPGNRKAKVKKSKERLHENENGLKEETKINKTPLARSRARTRIQLNKSNEEMQVKQNSTKEEKTIESSSVRPGKQINKDAVEENEVESEKEVVSRRERGKKRNISITPNEQIQSENINDEEEEIQIKSLIKARSRTRKQQQAVVDTAELVDESTTKDNKSEEMTPKTPLRARNRQKSKATSNSEKSEIEIVKKSPVVNNGNKENDVLSNVPVEEYNKLFKNAKQLNINLETPEFKTPTLRKTRVMPRRRVSINTTVTPNLNEENKDENEIGVRRSKRKAGNDTDNSISEDNSISTESITRGRRRRLHSEVKTNSEDESETVEPVKNTRGKRKLKEIPIESDVSEKRSTRRRK